MRITLAAVGRAKKGPERGLFDHYVARLSWPLTLREVEEKKPLPVAERRAREADLLRGCLPPGALLVCLDETGRDLGSEAFARRIGQWQVEGRSDMGLVIGGADGLDPDFRQGADLILSLGRMTWPHMLVRGLIAEQLFRAHCILSGHPYHRGG